MDTNAIAAASNNLFAPTSSIGVQNNVFGAPHYVLQTTSAPAQVPDAVEKEITIEQIDELPPRSVQDATKLEMVMSHPSVLSKPQLSEAFGDYGSKELLDLLTSWDLQDLHMLFLRNF